MSGRIGGRIGLIYLLGLYAASYLDTFGRLLFAAVLFLFGLLLLLRKKREMFWIAGTLAAAMLLFELYWLAVIEPQRAFIGSTALVTGIVSECTYPDNDTVRLTVEGNADGVPIRVTLYTTDFGSNLGDTVSFYAVFSDFRESANFSESDYSFSEGIFLRARAADDPEILKKAEFSILRLPKEFSLFLRERIGGILNGDEGGLIRAMFFGDRSGLSSSLSVYLKSIWNAPLADCSFIGFDDWTARKAAGIPAFRAHSRAGRRADGLFRNDCLCHAFGAYASPLLWRRAAPPKDRDDAYARIGGAFDHAV